MRRFLVPFLALAFVSLMPRTVLSWGNAPTHFSIANDLANNSGYTGLLPASDTPSLAIRGEMIHSLVEVSVDTLIFYNGTPIVPSTPPFVWENINVGDDACDPFFLILPSRTYR